MADNTELKRMAEACGDLNWRAIQENWCECSIRDDHGYIATMRTKSAKHPGPCPDREAKAKFLCVVTPAAVLALIAQIEQDEMHLRAFSSVAETAVAERDQLKAENEALRGLYQMHKQTETREMRDLKLENERLRKECARLTEDNLALLENPGDAL